MTSYKLLAEQPATISTERESQIAEVKTMMKENCLQMSRGCSIVIGMIIGCFIQCSTLGANFMMSTMYGQQIYFSREFVIVSLVWCFMTSLMGVSVLLFLRSLVVTAFYATNSSKGDEATLASKEDFMEKVIDNVEQFFAVGSLIGVGAAWTTTDILLGMQSHVYHSLLTLAVALVWCKFAMAFSSNSSDTAQENPSAEKQVAIQVV